MPGKNTCHPGPVAALGFATRPYTKVDLLPPTPYTLQLAGFREGTWEEHMPPGAGRCP